MAQLYYDLKQPITNKKLQRSGLKRKAWYMIYMVVK